MKRQKMMYPVSPGRNRQRNFWLLPLVSMVMLLLVGSQALAASAIETYWPLHAGDTATYAYGTETMTISVSSTISNQYKIQSQASDGSSGYEIHQLSSGKAQIISGGVGWTKISFSPAIEFLTDTVAQNGGTLTTATTVTQTGASYPATYTVTVGMAGTVTVPAGTFSNCRSINVGVVATVPGQGVVSYSSLTAVLAPGVGIIRKLVDPESGIWVELVSGTVGGVNVMQIPLAPAITTTSPLPAATTGTAYSQTLAASGGAQPYTWTVTSGSLPAGLNLSSDGVISGTAGGAATAGFTVKVTDSSGLSATKEMNLTINAAMVNGACGSSNGQILSTAPTSGLCSAGTATVVTETGPWSWDCNGSNGGSTVSCSASKQPPAPSGYCDTNGVVTITGVQSAISMLLGLSQPASCVDVDSSGNVSTSEVQKTINKVLEPIPVNTAPIANAGSPQNVVTGALVTLDGSGSSDANGDVLTYSWSLTSKPDGSSATLAAASAVNPTFKPDLAGTYVFNLVVNDGKVNSASVPVTLIVTASTYSISGTVSGLAGAGLVLQNNGGNDLSVTANGNFTFAIPLARGTTYGVTVKTQPANPAQTCTVNNGTGSIDNANVTNVTVNCVATAPAATFTALKGMMKTARTGHTATLLPNGKILVAGGAANDDSPASFTSAELYDPVTDTWSATGSMIHARAWHAAILLPNGKVLFAGGNNNDNAHAYAELYDPATGTWTATGSLITARQGGPSMVLLSNGKILIAGGAGENSPYYTLASAELYNPATGVWTATAPMSTARRNHAMTLLPNGKVLVAGGTIKYTNNVFNSAELYDPTTGQWSATGAMTEPRRIDFATLLLNGKVLVAGGSNSSYTSNTQNALKSAELYDPATGVWTATGSMVAARLGGGAPTLLPNGNVIIVGGWTGTNALSSAEIYNPATATWSTTGSMTARRVFADSILLPNGKVLVMGGVGDTRSPLKSAELYNP